MTGELAIRRMTAAAVLLVAAIAAVISFIHIEHLALTHGQTALAAALLPVSIDGTVAAASLVMLRAARAGLGTPWLARVMLGLAVVATLAANVANGARYGPAGALLSGWPAVAFIGSAEMALGMVRRTRQAAPDGPPDALPAPVPADAQSAALAALRATLAAGNPLSGRQLETRFGLSRAEVTKVRELAAAESNGHAAPEASARPGCSRRTAGTRADSPTRTERRPACQLIRPMATRQPWRARSSRSPGVPRTRPRPPPRPAGERRQAARRVAADHPGPPDRRPAPVSARRRAAVTRWPGFHAVAAVRVPRASCCGVGHCRRRPCRLRAHLVGVGRRADLPAARGGRRERSADRG